MGLRWYRFDPDRNERRHVPVAAHTQEWEFNQAWRELSKDLEQRNSLGLSEDIEHVSGVLLERGYLERVRQNRLQGRLMRQGWLRHPPLRTQEKVSNDPDPAVGDVPPHRSGPVTLMVGRSWGAGWEREH